MMLGGKISNNFTGVEEISESDIEALLWRKTLTHKAALVSFT